MVSLFHFGSAVLGAPIARAAAAFALGCCCTAEQAIILCCRAGDGAWVQLLTRCLAVPVLGSKARILPASMVMPNDEIQEESVWGGVPGKRRKAQAWFMSANMPSHWGVSPAMDTRATLSILQTLLVLQPIHWAS